MILKKLKGFAGFGETLQDFVLHILLPIAIILFLIALVVVYLNQSGFNVSIPNPLA